MTLGTRFEGALVYALHVHGGQLRKGTSIPYAAHLLAVASVVLEDGGDEDDAIAGLLHDAAEDQGRRARLADIRDRFGERVGRIVEGCTDTFDDPKPPWRSRKEAYVAHLGTAPDDVLRVSLADKLHNARAIVLDYRQHGDELWERFDRDSDQVWYYGALAQVFRERRAGLHADELAALAAELEERVVVASLRRLVAYGRERDYSAKYVILRGDDARNYYVQFAVDESGLFCEAVYNHYLEPAHHLTGDQVARLLALGWRPPEHDDQNFFRVYDLERDDYAGMLALARQAFVEVYGLPPGHPVGVSTSWRPRA